MATIDTTHVTTVTPEVLVVARCTCGWEAVRKQEGEARGAAELHHRTKHQEPDVFDGRTTCRRCGTHLLSHEDEWCSDCER